jgi:hypothetical protein
MTVPPEFGGAWKWLPRCCAGASAILFITGLALMLTWTSARNPVAFDRAQWLADPDPESSMPLRYRMARLLVEEQRLMGFEYAEVESMLGPPTDRYSIGYTLNEVEAILGRPTDRVPLVFPRREYPAWYLMPGGSDRIFLVVRVGTDGRVVSAEILAG